MPEYSAKYQYFAAFVVNLLSLAYGFAVGWTSPNFVLLTSDKTPLPSGKITMDEESWIAGTNNIGGLVGNFFFCFITIRFGRKKPLLLCAIPNIINWLLILFAQNVYYLYMARFVNGFIGSGIFVIIPLYLKEIASDRVRGAIGSTVIVFYTLGNLLEYIVGDNFDYYMAPKLMIGLTCLFAALFAFVPETPAFLLKHNKISEAEKSFRFYQNFNENEEDNALFQLFEKKKLQNSSEKIHEIDTSEKPAESLKWSDFRTREARKAFTIGIVLSALNELSGVYTMLSYSATVFEESGSSMSANSSTIVVGFILLIGSYVSTCLVDRAGRKFLFIVSSFGTALGLILFGVYMMLLTRGHDVEAFSWIPMVCFSFATFTASLAIFTLPFVVISEIMPENVKDFGITICVLVLYIAGFCLMKCFPLMITTFGIHGTMFIFGGTCLFSGLFIVKHLPETKGKSQAEIMNLLK